MKSPHCHAWTVCVRRCAADGLPAWIELKDEMCLHGATLYAECMANLNPGMIFKVE